MEQEKIYKRLTNGIEELCYKSDAVASELFFSGPNAVPISVTQGGEILVAASVYGRGRLVVFPHEAYLERPALNPLLLNCLSWLHPDATKTVVLEKKFPRLRNLLEENKYSTTYAESLVGAGTFCCYATTATRTKEILRHMKSGGGLLIAGQAWHWSSQHPEMNVFTDYPGNKITGPAGIFISSKSASPSVVQMPKEIPTVERSSRITYSPERDIEFLLNGLENLNLSMNSNALRLFTFDPLVFSLDLHAKTDGQVVAGRLGAGRFVVTSGPQLFHGCNGDKFLKNVGKWLLNGNPKRTVSIDCSVEELEAGLKQHYCCKKVTLDDAGLFCCGSSTEVEPGTIKAFVEEGGGFLWCGKNCHSRDIFKMKEGLTEYPGNKVLNSFGVGILPLTLKGDAMKMANYTSFFEKFSKSLAEDLTIPSLECTQSFVKECSDVLKCEDFTNRLYTNLVDELLSMASDNGCLSTCSSTQKSFKSEPSKFVLAVLADLFDVLPDKKTLFVPPQDCIHTQAEVSLTIEARNRARKVKWISTGLYAVRGETVIITVPEEIIDKGLKVQIGCHSDKLFNKSELKRAPEVTRTVPIKTKSTKIRYLWGGLVYFLLPGNCDLGVTRVTIQNAARAPYFKFGVNTADEWRDIIRHYPAPWAELEADNIVMTVPAEVIRNLDEPTTVLELWNEIMKEVAHLAAIPPQFPMPERLVADVQISAGSMHSGYPIMFHNPSAPQLVDVAKIKSSGIWGYIHELGHNQQGNKWELRPHTTEATCNLWSVYIHEKVLNISRDKAHGNLEVKKRKKRLEEYVKNGAKLEDWTMWTALETYLQLQEGFGWEAFIDLHAQYHKIPCGSESNKAKMGRYAGMFSKTVKKNLIPFFKSWGWEIEDSFVQELAALEEWGDDPMKQFRSNVPS